MYCFVFCCYASLLTYSILYHKTPSHTPHPSTLPCIHHARLPPSLLSRGSKSLPISPQSTGSPSPKTCGGHDLCHSISTVLLPCLAKSQPTLLPPSPSGRSASQNWARLSCKPLSSCPSCMSARTSSSPDTRMPNAREAQTYHILQNLQPPVDVCI